MGLPEFLHGLNSLTTKHRGCVATIGSFDGLHLGHEVVLRQVTDKADELAVPSLAMVFEPQPYEYFSRQAPPARLMRLREKVCALFDAGIDRVLCLKFNEALRSLTAKEYIERVLIEGVGVRHLVIGDDFRFGCDRSGDFAMLCEAGKRAGFSVCDTDTQMVGGERISSTRIRKLLEADKLDSAAALLGRPYSISGRVGYGQQMGRSLGFPTLNIALGRFRSPLHGVYAVEVVRSGTESANAWWGVANIGARPTLESSAKLMLETHILDRDVSIYGEFVTVSFKKKIREEKRFASLDALRLQIEKDSQAARNYFSGVLKLGNN